MDKIFFLRKEAGKYNGGFSTLTLEQQKKLKGGLSSISSIKENNNRFTSVPPDNTMCQIINHAFNCYNDMMCG